MQLNCLCNSYMPFYILEMGGFLRVRAMTNSRVVAHVMVSAQNGIKETLLKIKF